MAVANTPSLEFTTPIGRFVQGDLFKGSDKDRKGNPYIIKTGPNKGQPTTRYFFAVAFAKTDAAFMALWQQLAQLARQGYPQYFDANGNCTHPRFTYKIVDGDGVDDDGKPNNTKEGFAGHWVVKFSGSFPPKVFHAGKYDPMQQVTDPAQVKRGWYIRVAANAKPNIGSDVPGLYLNASLVSIEAAGPEITSGPDASAAFAQPAGPLPQGATAVPMSPQPGAMPQQPAMMPNMAAMGMPGVPQALPGVAPSAHPAGMQQPIIPAQPVAPAMPMGMPGPASLGAVAQPAGLQMQAVTPNAGFVANVAAMMGGQQAARTLVMTPAAQGITREQFHQQGYGDEQIVAAGMGVWQ